MENGGNWRARRWEGTGKSTTVKVWICCGLVLWPRAMLLEANKPYQ